LTTVQASTFGVILLIGSVGGFHGNPEVYQRLMLPPQRVPAAAETTLLPEFWRQAYGLNMLPYVRKRENSRISQLLYNYKRRPVEWIG